MYSVFMSMRVEKLLYSQIQFVVRYFLQQRSATQRYAAQWRIARKCATHLTCQMTLN